MDLSRRDFLAVGAGCAAHLLLARNAIGDVARRFAAGPLGAVIETAPWARIERVADGAWAVVSTPLAGPRGSDSWRTISNGGIIAGREGVLLVEGLATLDGARWMADRARRLTGRDATHVVLTHFHSDHSAGLGGYHELEAPPALHATEQTRALLLARYGGTIQPVLPEVVIPADAPTTLDLGGRTVRITPRSGHTPSDVSIRLDDEDVVFCGDLLWYGMIPNYVDAIPPRLSRNVRSLAGEGARVFIPGHGALTDVDGMRRYIALIDDIEAASRRAHDAGLTAEEAAERYRLPADVAGWTVFSKDYVRRAIDAWLRELAG